MENLPEKNPEAKAKKYEGHNDDKKDGSRANTLGERRHGVVE